MIRKITIPAALRIAGLACVLAACSNSTPAPTATPAAAGFGGGPRVAVTATPAVATVSVNGELTTIANEISVRFETNAKVTAVNVRPGQKVKKGDVLATLDPTALKDAVADAQLALDLTEANILASSVPATKEAIAAAQAALNAAYATYSTTVAGATSTEIENARQSAESAWLSYLSSQISRDRACSTGTETMQCRQAEASFGSAYESLMLARSNYEKTLQPVTASSVASANAAVQTSKSKLEDLTAGPTDLAKKQAETQRSQAKAALETATENLAKATLLAPCDCIVQAVNVGVGSTPSGVAFSLIDVSALQFVTTNLVERNVAQIQVGAPVTIRLKAYSEPLTGTVRSVLAQSSGVQSSSALYTAQISLAPTDKVIYPGMTGQADIVAR